jgi:hypothetical protein
MKTFLYLAVLWLTTNVPALELSHANALAIGKKIWKNECDGTVEGLTSWNQGEAFASLGIGHFIWYPAGVPETFEESFPKMTRFVAQRGAKLPSVVLKNQRCPWPNLQAFEADRHSSEMIELRAFLKDTVALQAEFAAQRLEGSLPKIMQELPETEKAAVEKKFQSVAAHPQGLYALMDYVNFKGEGVNPKERYHGQGWGLLQVLQEMKTTQPGAPAVSAFSTAAVSVLERRVKNSPPERNEKRWLPGWTSRCLSYLP